jgi:hypothetical protein
MASELDAYREESASDSGWRLLYQQARRLMAQESYTCAADILRLLGLAAPGEAEIWNALAECHDAENRPDVGDTLRALGRLVQTQLQPPMRSS